MISSKTLRLAAFLGTWMVATAVQAQFRPGPQVTTFQSAADDSDQPYSLYLPRHYNPRKKYPLVISLHGAGSNHRLNLRRVFGLGNHSGETDAEASRVFPEFPDIDCIVASPLARGTMGYQGLPEEDVYAVLDDVEKRFSIDKDRVYLTGLSMGGGGTLWLGLTRPDVWAAIAPCCPAAPPGTLELAGNALDLPVHLFQGGADPVVNPQGTRDWATRLKELGVKVEYTEYPGVQHNSWDNAYKDAQIFKWLFQFKRSSSPNEVRFRSDRYKYASAYWVHLDRLVSGRIGSIDAKFTGRNAIAINTEDLDAFSLSPKGNLSYSDRLPLTVKVDSTTLTVPAGQPLAFHKSEAKWELGKANDQTLSKLPNLEGPISDAFKGRQVYVYGTGGNPTPDELRRREAEARSAATWVGSSASIWSGPGHTTSFPVIRDTDFNAAMMSQGTIILLGTSRTNKVVAQLSPKLPFEFVGDEASYGLVFAYPVNGQYVVISSGLPWWSNASSVRSPRFRWRFGPAGPLTALGDYVLFHGSLNEILQEGFFGQDWTLQPDEAAKLSASPAIKLNR